MANSFYSGSITLEAGSAIGTAKAVKVAYILYTPASSGDAMLLYDHASAATNLKATIKGTGAVTQFIDLSNKPLVFINGVYATLAASGTATLITTSEGTGS